MARACGRQQLEIGKEGRCLSCVLCGSSWLFGPGYVKTHRRLKADVASVLYVFSADVGKIRTYIHTYIHYIMCVYMIFHARQVADC